ncbi:MAG: VOC family protein [Planctomycetota bacterium]
MPKLPAIVARPFVPAKDLAQSASFYEALGFAKLLDSPQIAIFSCGGAGGFLLQPYDAPGFAEQFMMQLMVPDLDAWWAHLAGLDLPGRFGVPAPKAPKLQPWGLRVAYVVDPSGVLWHVAEARPDTIHDRA